jgi:hypothetical protein
LPADNGLPLSEIKKILSAGVDFNFFKRVGELGVEDGVRI